MTARHKYTNQRFQQSWTKSCKICKQRLSFSKQKETQLFLHNAGGEFAQKCGNMKRLSSSLVADIDNNTELFVISIYV